jgi:putative transposase
MLLTYQYRLQPNSEQAAILSHWGELLRRHWNYALGERLDYLRRTRSSIDRCSLISEPIGDIPSKVDYYSQAANLKETKSLFPEYKNIYADGWYVSFSLEDNTVPTSLPVDKIKKSVGIDVGLEKFLTTSDAESIAVPQFYRKAQKVLARQQRKLCRQEKGSNNYKVQANKIARLHLHIHWQRKDFHYAVAHYLCSNYDLIGFEKLNIKGLAKTRLAKSILDVAWRTFLNILQAVAVRRGKHTQACDARGTSIECFNCEERVVKDLSVRVHDCPNCGVSLDRDYNAAINVLKRTAGLSFAACGDLGVAQSMKQEISGVNLRSPHRTALSG